MINGMHPALVQRNDSSKKSLISPQAEDACNIFAQNLSLVFFANFGHLDFLDLMKWIVDRAVRSKNDPVAPNLLAGLCDGRVVDYSGSFQYQVIGFFGHLDSPVGIT